MEKTAYLVNSTPKYYYMLPLHFTLLDRYAPFVTMRRFLATEVPDHPICQQLVKEHGVELIPLKDSESGFLESRAVALQALALTGHFLYVLPMQEDFLLDRTPDLGGFEEALTILQLSRGEIASARLMPCPGPKGPMCDEYPSWSGITSRTDTYGFTFQATLWTLEACCRWYRALTTRFEEEFPFATTSPEQRRHAEIRVNFAENADGQRFFWEFFGSSQQVHIGWNRAGPWPNAVYISPWPYRPTAIVQGRLEPWASELAAREGMPFAM